MPPTAFLKKSQILSILGIGLVFGANVSQPNMAIAQTNLIPEGQCAVIVASRQTIEDTQNYIKRNFVEPSTAALVFGSQNGWYAISIGLLPTEIQAEWLTREKSAERVPEDAYCSMGTRFVSVAVWDWKIHAAENAREASNRVEFEDPPDAHYRAMLASLPRIIYSTGCDSVLKQPMAESSRSELQAFLNCLDDRDESENLAIKTVIEGVGLKLVVLDSGDLRIEDDGDSDGCFDVCWEKVHDRLRAITMRTNLRELARSQARDALSSR